MYPFNKFQVKITDTGPDGPFSLGLGAAPEESITTTPSVRSSMTTGADRSVQHNLYADKSGRPTVRLLKDSQVNAQLSMLYNFQTSLSGSRWYGRNTITIANKRGEVEMTCDLAAFANAGTNDGNCVKWELHVGMIDR